MVPKTTREHIHKFARPRDWIEEGYTQVSKPIILKHMHNDIKTAWVAR